MKQRISLFILLSLSTLACLWWAAPGELDCRIWRRLILQIHVKKKHVWGKVSYTQHNCHKKFNSSPSLPLKIVIPEVMRGRTCWMDATMSTWIWALILGSKSGDKILTTWTCNSEALFYLDMGTNAGVQIRWQRNVSFQSNQWNILENEHKLVFAFSST